MFTLASHLTEERLILNAVKPNAFGILCLKSNPSANSFDLNRNCINKPT